MSIILLDIGNVIVSVDFEPFCRTVSLDGDVGAETIKRRYCESILKDRFDSGLVGPGEFLGMMAEDPLTVDMPPFYFRSAWQRIFTLVPGAIEGIGRLQEQHELWIMSDTDPLHFAFLIDKFPVMRRMDRFFLSYEHGYLKRDPDAFRHVLDCSGLDAREFILVDDREVNLRSCRKSGMDGILFREWSGTLASPLLSGRKP
jgi:FMN phosphatase YigB (HAD superfamily)